jgi:hypothetical protein
MTVLGVCDVELDRERCVCVCVASDDWHGVVDADRGLCSFERPREVYISFRR